LARIKDAVRELKSAAVIEGPELDAIIAQREREWERERLIATPSSQIKHSSQISPPPQITATAGVGRGGAGERISALSGADSRVSLVQSPPDSATLLNGKTLEGTEGGSEVLDRLESAEGEVEGGAIQVRFVVPP
jgi:hypothetical protein